MRTVLGLTAVVCALGVPRPTEAARGQAGLGSFLGEGSLVTSENGAVVKVPLKHTRVAIAIAGQLAHARVRQRFENPYLKKIEATYLFPLPTGAAVRRFELRSGDRLIRGRLLPRAEARAVFKRASAEGKVAALLEQERPNLFVQTVANLEPGKAVEVVLEYVEQVRVDESGDHELVFPMVVGPRFVEKKRERGGSALASPPVLPPALRSGHEIDLRVSIDAGLPLEGLSSPSHRVHATPRGSRAELSIDKQDRVPNKDFVLRYRVSGATTRAGMITHARNGAGHFLLTLQPPLPSAAARAAATPRELIFVVDTSSSMTGAPLAQARALVRRMLERVAPADTFQIVRFEERVASLGERMIAARPGNVALALRWLDSLKARGGTLVGKGIEHALALPHDPARLRILVLLSDGYIGDEEEVLRLARRKLGTARVFVFGIGTATNRYLLEELATIGRGAVQVLRPDEPAGPAVERFARRISRPLLTDLSLEVRGIAVHDLVPSRIPDLFAGQPLQVLGRFRGSGSGEAILRGRSAGTPVAIRVPLRVPAGPHGPEGVALAWARARIAEEERALLAPRAERGAIRRRVLELSLRHGILTRYTSFVAVDEDSRTEGDSLKVVVPVDRPDGLLSALNRGGVGGVSLHGSSHGGGLTLHGSGHGGGGNGYGTIGLGTLGVIGKAGGGAQATFGRALAHHAASAPLIVSGAVIVQGSLDKEILRRVIRSRMNEVRFCYERELALHPGLAGKVTVSFTIAPTGAVVASSVSQSTLGSAGAESCIAQAARRWTFPTVAGGGIVVVNYPFVFRPSDPPPRTRIAPHGGAEVP